MNRVLTHSLKPGGAAAEGVRRRGAPLRGGRARAGRRQRRGAEAGGREVRQERPAWDPLTGSQLAFLGRKLFFEFFMFRRES